SLRRRVARRREVRRMARKKRPHKTSPKTPSRVRKRRGKKTKARSHHHPELVGLGLVALGVFLAAILWFGFNGGPVADLVTDAIGDAAYLAPLVLVPLGALIVGRSAVVDVRPFRLGLGVALLGLMLTPGAAHAGRRQAGLPGPRHVRAAERCPHERAGRSADDRDAGAPVRAAGGRRRLRAAGAVAARSVAAGRRSERRGDSTGRRRARHVPRAL